MLDILAIAAVSFLVGIFVANKKFREFLGF